MQLIEPVALPGFVPTGAAAPAPVPNEPILELARSVRPEIVVCLGGALFINETARSAFPRGTVFVGVAL